MDVSLSGLLIVAGAAFGAPLLLGLAPGLRLPSAVLEIVAGIVLGPSVLGWVKVDEPIEVLSLVGLAFLLFLAGLEVDPQALRGRSLRLASLGVAASLAIAIAVGFGLDAAGLAEAPLLVGVILLATSLGVVVPVLKDSGEAGTPLGQLVIVAASIADFGAIIALTLLFSGESGSVGGTLVLLGGFVLLVAAVGVAVTGAGRWMRLTDALLRLQDTTAQIRVRGAFALLVLFAVLAKELGFETILGAFAAGAVLTLVDRDRMMTHPRFREKLEAAGYGIFVPVFFVTSGIKFNLDALTSSGSTLALLPVFLAALLLVHGVPALLYGFGRRQTAVAALLQATSLPFIVAATTIGVEMGKLSEGTAAALVGAGLLSVLLFPLLALSLLRREASAAVLPAAEGV